MHFGTRMTASVLGSKVKGQGHNMTKDQCSEISCNVKWNVYLAMEIPDCVSFISGQNSDDRVRSCEPNVFLA